MRFPHEVQNMEAPDTELSCISDIPLAKRGALFQIYPSTLIKATVRTLVYVEPKYLCCLNAGKKCLPKRFSSILQTMDDSGWPDRVSDVGGDLFAYRSPLVPNPRDVRSERMP